MLAPVVAKRIGGTMPDPKDNYPKAENTPPVTEKVPQNPTSERAEPSEELKEGDLNEVVGGTAGFKFY